jgi:sulfate transport system ATP-binding protein
MTIELVDVAKSFGAYAALDGVSMRVARGELVALLGPSGCGKTTILRVIAGLEAPDGGRVLFDGDDATARPPGARGVGFVFQSYALFEHMSVHENVAFALRVRGERDRAVRERVERLLARVRLDGLGARRPSQLSGGQRQRVAIARALAASPGVLLLDEPFGALDAHVRAELRAWLRELHDETHTATVLVTHDREDAFAIADRVVVLHEGRVAQSATPRELEAHPASPWVAHFLGNAAAPRT